MWGLPGDTDQEERRGIKTGLEIEGLRIKPGLKLSKLGLDRCRVNVQQAGAGKRL